MQDQFKKLAKQYHPDAAEQKLMNDSQIQVCNERFISVKEAYDRIIELNNEKVLFKENLVEEDAKKMALERVKKIAMAREQQSSYY